MTNNEAAPLALKVTDALNASATGTVTAAVTCYDNEDFDQFEDYTAIMVIDRCWYRPSAGEADGVWFISGMVDMSEHHDCDDDCDDEHTPERFDVALDDGDEIEFVA